MFFKRITSIAFTCLVVGCQSSVIAPIQKLAGLRTAPRASHRFEPSRKAHQARKEEKLNRAFEKLARARRAVAAAQQTTQPHTLPVPEPPPAAEPPSKLADEPASAPEPAQPSKDESTTELMLQQLEHMALANNPAFAEARARVDAARGKWVQVGLPPNTMIGYSGQQLGSNGAAEQQGIFIGQEFIRGDKLRLNRSVVFHEIQKAEHLRAAQQQRVITDVRLAYYDVLVAQRRNITTSQLVEIAQEAVETAEALLEAQEVAQIDVIRSRIELQTAQLMLKNSRNRSVAAWSGLAAVVGLPEMTPRQLKGDVETVVAEIDATKVLKRLLRESPEMDAALSDVERAHRVVERAQAEPIPNVDLQAILQSDNATGTSNANFQISIPLPWRNRNQGGIRQARAEVIAAERTVDRLALSFRQRLAGVYQRYSSARDQVEDYSRDDGILANSETALELIRKGYEAGELNYLDLITAQRTFSRTTLAYIEALGELWAAVVEIEGLLLKNSLGSEMEASQY